MVYMNFPPRVLHFSAFIMLASSWLCHSQNLACICEPERLAFIGCLSDLSRIHVISPTGKGSVLKEML